jgi:hemoglobin-like flavoprotein
MTPRQKQIVRDSFQEMRGLAGPLSQLFYGRLFELEPETRRLFHEDIKRQGMKLMDMLSAVVDNLEQIETLRPALEAMGQRHVTYGVVARHYDTVEQALLWSFGHALGADFNPELRTAWRTVIGQVSTAMKQGADSGQ